MGMVVCESSQGDARLSKPLHAHPRVGLNLQDGIWFVDQVSQEIVAMITWALAETVNAKV